MPRLDILLTGHDTTDEIIERSSSTALALGHDTIRGTADLEIWTGAGGTGTQLALTTDYTVSDEDSDLSTEAGVSIYTKLAIVNGTYHNTPLYVSYKTIGDYGSSGTVRLISIGYEEVTGNYTVTADDRTLVVTTASAVTITLPEGMPLGFDVCISRTVASTNSVTVARSGSDTIEGVASFITHRAFASSTLDNSVVGIIKKSSTNFGFSIKPVIRLHVAQQSSGISANNPLKFASTVVDSHSGWNATNGQYTVKLSGKYKVTAFLYSSAGAASLVLYKNTAFLYHFADLLTTSRANASIEVDCIAGDVLDIRNNTSTSSADTQGFMQIELVN